MRTVVWTLTLVLLAVSPTAGAIDPRDPLEDPELQQRYERMIQEVRCLVCQNEPIADSNAPLAADLRREIRDQLRAGNSDEEIIGFLTARYGDFVLYRPPFQPTTWLLWFAPLLLLAAGAFAFVRVIRNRAGQPMDDDDDDDETAEGTAR